jgi:hypothetical protein
MSRKSKLEQLIQNQRIVFDDAAQLKPQLLNSTWPWLQDLVIRVAQIGPAIRISSVTGGTHEPTSLHYNGRGLDIGNEDVAAQVLPTIVSNVGAWHLDEIIFDASMLNDSNGSPLAENLWNHKLGQRFSYSAGVLRPSHRTHIHLAVRFGGTWSFTEDGTTVTVELRQVGSSSYAGFVRNREDGEVETFGLSNLAGDQTRLRGSITVEGDAIAVTLTPQKFGHELKLELAADGDAESYQLTAEDPW